MELMHVLSTFPCDYNPNPTSIKFLKRDVGMLLCCNDLVGVYECVDFTNKDEDCRILDQVD